MRRNTDPAGGQPPSSSTAQPRSWQDIGLAWGDVAGDGTFRLFRGVKIRLVDVDPGIVEDAMRPGRQLVARVRLTDARGNPICARVRPPDIAWSAERAP